MGISLMIGERGSARVDVRGIVLPQMPATPTMKIERPRVAALVLNSVSHDARVLKEADSLADAGFDVHIIGIQDKRSGDALTRRSEGVSIHRVSLGPAMMALKYRVRSWLSLIGALAFVVVALAVLFTPLRAGLTGLLDNFGIPSTLIAIGCLFFAVRLVLRYQRLSNSAMTKTREAGLQGPVAGLKSTRAALVSRSLLKVWAHYQKYRIVSKLYCHELDRLGPHAVHCHDLPMLPIGAKWCKANSAAFLVFDSHELYEEVSQMSPLMRHVWQRVLRRNSSKVDAFITVNDSIAEEHARRYPALPPAVVVKNATIVNGEPLVRSNLLREAAELDDDALVLLYQGGFARHRGLELLIRAAAKMPDPWILVMMGWGNIEDDLKSLAAKVDPCGRQIRFIPPAPHADLKAWTSGGDLGVIPYENTCLNHWYCSPNKLWEYPVAGVPMLVSPFPELMAVVETHGIGVCLPEQLDGAALRRVLSEIDRERLECMRHACESYIKKDNWAVYARRLVEIYNSRFDRDPETTSKPPIELEEGASRRDAGASV